MSTCYHEWPAIGICFDVGKIDDGKYGMKCWEILWGAVAPQQIAGSLLLEGAILERDDVYCLAVLNQAARCIEQLARTLVKDIEFREVCASPGFFTGETVAREPLVCAGEVNEAGNIIGISENARAAFNKVKRARTASFAVQDRPAEVKACPCPGVSPAVKVSSSAMAPRRLK